MPVIRMPDNTQVQFPDDMPPEQIKGLIASKFPKETQTIHSRPEQQKTSMFEDFAKGGGNILTERGLGIIQLLDESTGGSLLSPEYREASYRATEKLRKEREGLGAVGTIANIAADPLMALPLAKTLKGAKALAAGGAVAGAAAGALSGKTKEENRLTDTLASGTVGTVLSPIVGKGAELTTDVIGNISGKVGQKLFSSAEKSIANKRQKFIQDLVLPSDTAGRSLRSEEQGLLRAVKYNPTESEKLVMNEVSNLKAINPNRSAQYNLNVVQKGIGDYANKLKTELEGLNIIFPKKEYNKRLINDLQNVVNTHPVLVGDAANTANRLIPEIQKILKKYPSTPAGMLEARKAMDKTLESFKPKFFEAGADNAFQIIGKTIRNTTNDFIAEKAPNVSVKNLLQKQSNLYDALNNIAPKADKLAKNSISRLAQRVGKLVPLKGEIAGLAALGGVGMAISPAAALTAGGVYGAGKLATSPITKKSLGELLKATNKAMGMIKDKNLIQEMRIDRGIILDLLKSKPESERISDDQFEA